MHQLIGKKEGAFGTGPEALSFFIVKTRFPRRRSAGQEINRFDSSVTLVLQIIFPVVAERENSGILSGINIL